MHTQMPSSKQQTTNADEGCGVLLLEQNENTSKTKNTNKTQAKQKTSKTKHKPNKPEMHKACLSVKAAH